MESRENEEKEMEKKEEEVSERKWVTGVGWVVESAAACTVSISRSGRVVKSVKPQEGEGGWGEGQEKEKQKGKAKRTAKAAVETVTDAEDVEEEGFVCSVCAEIIRLVEAETSADVMEMDAECVPAPSTSGFEFSAESLSILDT